MWVDIIEKVGNGSIKTVLLLYTVRNIQTADDSQDVCGKCYDVRKFFTTLNVKYFIIEQRETKTVKHPPTTEVRRIYFYKVI